MYTIKCENPTQFMDFIESLVQRGVYFEANGETLIIELNGAY